MNESGEGSERWLWAGVWGAALLVVAALAVALGLWIKGPRGRAAGRPNAPPAPSPQVRPQAPPRARPQPVRPSSPPAAPKEEAKTPAFQGAPLSWGVGENQRLFFQEPIPPGSRAYLVVMSPDRDVLGTLYLNLDSPVLPSRYLIKDATWGQAKRFGGDDILLGVVACPLPPSGSAFQRAAEDEAWWQGKLKPAFQTNF